MSYELQDLVWEMELPSSEKLVLLALAYRTDAKGFCFPSVPNISKITGLNVKTVRAVLSKLEKLGLLSIDMRPGKATIYTVNPYQNWVYPKTGVPKNNPTQKRVGTTTKIGCTPLPKLVDEQVKNKEITSKQSIETNTPQESQGMKTNTPQSIEFNTLQSMKTNTRTNKEQIKEQINRDFSLMTDSELVDFFSSVSHEEGIEARAEYTRRVAAFNKQTMRPDYEEPNRPHYEILGMRS